MRLFALTTLTMIAFAANSVLTRAGVAVMDIGSFGAFRLWSGAAMLVVLALWSGQKLRIGGRQRALSVSGLLVYIVGFTAAYLGMDSGLGALLLFGMVQITMFFGALLQKEAMPVLRLMGGLVAMVGLAYLVWPWTSVASSPLAIFAMAAAGIGWGLYSLAGRGSAAPLADTAMNFVLAGLLYLPLLLWIGSGYGGTQISPSGVMLAITSGAITSGLGYALWYALLPKLQASLAAVAQLAVPPIAMLGGMVFLGEAMTIKFAIGALIVLGGVALSILGPAYFAKSSSAS